MKNKVFKHLQYLFWALAIVFATAFIVLVIVGYFRHKKLLSIPNALVAPFCHYVKRIAKRLLIPSAVFWILGYVFKKLR